MARLNSTIMIKIRLDAWLWIISMLNRLPCLVGLHRKEVKQHGFMVDTGRDDVVIAWWQCDRCAKSKLIHILK